MQELPDKIKDAGELDELLSRPRRATVELMGRLEGDIMILGAGGKIGPSMAGTAKRAVEEAGVNKEILAVDVVPLPALEELGIKTMTCDMLDEDAVAALPKVENIVYMVGRKFGSTGQEHLTWAINVIVPYHVAKHFVASRIAAFSTGCVYPVMDMETGGAVEETPPGPIGEYAQSCLGRERMFDYFAQTRQEKVVHVRLNYAIDLRYGVLFDIGSKVWNGEVVDVTTGYANVIWQGDACNQILQSLELAASPAKILNVTGPETISVRESARKFGELMGKEAAFSGEENGLGYLSNAAQANSLFGAPEVSVDRMIQWTAHWVMSGGEGLGKPTHFETQDGKY